MPVVLGQVVAVRFQLAGARGELALGFAPGTGQLEPDRYDLTQDDWHWIRDNA